MSIFRGLRRRLRQANPCTAFLLVLLVAVIIFLVSAAKDSSRATALINSASAADGRRRLSSSSDDVYEKDTTQKRKYQSNKHHQGWFVVADEEIQTCQMTPQWTKSGTDGWRVYPVDMTSHKMAWWVKCILEGDKPLAELFYVQNGMLWRNLTVMSLHSWTVANCSAEEIVWKSDHEYETIMLSEGSKVNSEFIHIRCLMWKNYGIRKQDGSNNESVKGVDASKTGGNRWQIKNAAETEQHQSSSDNIEEQAKQLQRRVVHQHSPRLAGSVGLPDPSDLLLGKRIPLAVQSDEYSFAVKSEAGVGKSSQKPEFHDATQDKDKSADDEDAKQFQQRQEDNLNFLSTISHKDEHHENKEIDQLSGFVADEEAVEYIFYDQFVINLNPVEEVVHHIDQSVLKGHGANHQPNVLVLALDSVSRFSFDRNLPRTRQLLEETLQAVVMDGYNVLGDAAADNIVPLLTGKVTSELNYIRINGDGANYVDSLPFVWNKFEAAGYATLYAEDQPALGTFQLNFHGFEDKPVHHYMRPFWQASADIAKTRLDGRHHCLGMRAEYEYLFTYVEQFFSKYNQLPTGTAPQFAFAFLTDVISDGDIAITRAFDENLKKFIERLVKTGLLDNTVLVITGDHGPSFGSSRHTLRGMAEERLPLLVIALPSSFKTKYSQLANNLVANRDRLTTALDVHAMLLHLLNFNATVQDTVGVSNGEMAVSLLRQIPIQRNCRTAGIAVHWCMCTYFEDVDVTGGVISAEWQATAEFIVEQINKLLKPGLMHCVPLKLEHIINVKYIIPSDVVIETENKFYLNRRLNNFTRRHPGLDRYQQATVQTLPSGSTFEATVHFNPITGQRRISGQISRISAYGDESKCIMTTYPELRKYCFCREPMS
jgi:hypothetical protein